MADRVCCRQGVVALLSMSIALSGGTDMWYELTASARKLSEGEASLAVLMDAINVAVEWCANERSPRPPLLKLNWACFQELSVV